MSQQHVSNEIPPTNGSWFPENYQDFGDLSNLRSISYMRIMHKNLIENVGLLFYR